MGKIFAILLAFIATNSFADFSLNVEHPQVLKELNAITLNDLGVGESGFIQFWDGMCKLPAGNIGLNKYIELESDRSEYGTYLKITRLPNGEVAIAATP